MLIPGESGKTKSQGAITQSKLILSEGLFRISSIMSFSVADLV
jgi:hypothetical protein